MKKIVLKTEAVYLKGKELTGAYLMKKDNQLVYVRNLGKYKSQIEFVSSDTYFGEKHESEYFEKCDASEFLEAFNDALKVIITKICN